MVGRKLSSAAIVGSIAAGALFGACRDSATTGPSQIASKDFATNLRVQGGDAQTGSAGIALPLPLLVKVVDAGGNEVSGATVTWSVISGNGAVNPPTGVSNSAGLVTTNWILGTGLGANKVRAYLSHGFVLDSATFNATSVGGTGVIIVLDSTSLPPASAPVATVMSALTFNVSDQFGHPVPGASVAFATGANSGTVAPAAGLTDANGAVKASWTLGTVAGTQSVSATLAGQLPVTFVATATPDTSRRIAILSGDAQTASVNATLPTTLTVQVTDRFNNVIANEPVNFADSLTGGTQMTQPSPTTDATGTATATWRLSLRPGAHVARVKTPGSGGQFVRFNATATIAFRDVFAGDYYACGIGTNDRAYCWGFGQDGQLGNIALVNRSGPSWPVTQVDTLDGPFPTFRSISGGKSHACGISVARTLFCWGYNPDQRQFLAASGRSAKAVDVTTAGGFNLLLASTSVVSAGEVFSCAVTNGGIALCAGNDESGQTGTGVAPAPSVATALVDTVTINPVKPKHYSMIAVGQRHACGMPRVAAPSAVAWCWGQNNNGQLGDGLAAFADSLRPSPVNMATVLGGVFDTTSLVAGTAHTCALTPTGTAYCWGSNSNGQLGNASVAIGGRSSSPVTVAGPAFVHLYSGEFHTCGLTAGGQAWCWGRNASGQLGIGTTTDSPTPVAVTTALTFRTLSLGELFTCGVTGTPVIGAVGTTGSAGTIYCWGDNEFGQLGIGTFSPNGAPVLTPARVAFQQ